MNLKDYNIIKNYFEEMELKRLKKIKTHYEIELELIKEIIKEKMDSEKNLNKNIIVPIKKEIK